MRRSRLLVALVAIAALAVFAGAAPSAGAPASANDGGQRSASAASPYALTHDAFAPSRPAPLAPAAASPCLPAPPWPVPSGDDDCDGFSTTIETFVGTDPTYPCSPVDFLAVWPPDFNNSNRVDLTDIVLLKPHFNSSLGQPAYSQRFDLNADNQINLADVVTMKPYFNQNCYNGCGLTDSVTVWCVVLDMDPTGNTATQLGPADWCTHVAIGATATIDVTVNAVPAFDPGTGAGGVASFGYDLKFNGVGSGGIQVNAVDDNFLLTANGGTVPVEVINYNAPGGPAGPPGTGGDVRVDYADTGASPPESGAGVLSRVTIQGLTDGLSFISFANVYVADRLGNRYRIVNAGQGAVAVGTSIC